MSHQTWLPKHDQNRNANKHANVEGGKPTMSQSLDKELQATQRKADSVPQGRAHWLSMQYQIVCPENIDTSDII